MRIGLCTLLAVRLAITDFDEVSGLPEALYQPSSYMALLGGMPSAGSATALQLVGIAAAVLAAAGVLVRVSLPVALVSALVLNGMVNSAGRVIVGDALLMLCLLVLAGAGTAATDAWSLRRHPVDRPPVRGARYGWPVRTAMIVVALAYFLAGFQKWRHSGLAWITSDNIRWILYASAEGSRTHGLGAAIADRPLLAHALAAGALLLETAFPLVLVLRRARWLLIGGAIAMHLTIRLTLGLDYSAQGLTAVIVFADWPVIVDRVRAASLRHRRRIVTASSTSIAGPTT
jgi:hypothetical protein